jgi:hypothetical protein
MLGRSRVGRSVEGEHLMSFEVVNNKDGTRMSRSMAKGSSTVFATEAMAQTWMGMVGLSPSLYSIKPAKEEE